MAKFLTGLPEVFRQRFLNRHEKYLKSLADVINYYYLGGDIKEPNYGKLAGYLAGGSVPIRLVDEPRAEQIQFRNLRNSWYHELSLRYPEDFEQRTKFAGWKIIQSYYAIFSSVASMVRCLHPNGALTHDATLNIYAREIVASKQFKNSVIPPASTYLNQQGNLTNHQMLESWDYAKSYHVPLISESLRSARQERSNITTVVHYLKDLREWATYEDAYLLFMMYGASVKSNLDYSLQMLTSFYVMQEEVFLTKVFGIEAMETQVNQFNSWLGRALGMEHTHLLARLGAIQLTI